MAFTAQNFVNGTTPAISAAFLNGLDLTVNGVLGGAQTVSQAVAALGLTNAAEFVPVGLLPPTLFLNGPEIFTVSQNGDPVSATIQQVVNLSVANAEAVLAYKQTAAEAFVSVLPANTSIQSGPMRYGAVGNGLNDDAPAWNQMGIVSDYQFIQTGTYLFEETVSTFAFLTWVGANRGSVTLTPAQALTGPLLQIGRNPSGNPTIGELRRLLFQGGAAAQTCLLEMNTGSHNFDLSDLYFKGDVSTTTGLGCPALVVNGCWDSTYENITVYGCGYPNQPAYIGAAVKFIGACNNIYLPNLHIEGAPSGAVYFGAGGPFRLYGGKIDLGNIGQVAPMVTVDTGAFVAIDNFTMTGANEQPYLQIQGSLKMSLTDITGSSGTYAIDDNRVWTQMNGGGSPAFGPAIPEIELSLVDFDYASINTVNVTQAAINSKIPGFRYQNQLSVTASSAASATTTNVATNLTAGANILNNLWLVHNPTGTKTIANNAGSRRKILVNFANGQLVVAGGWPLTIDGDWSLEYSGGHYTPNLVLDNCSFAGDIFQVILTGCSLTGNLTYVPANNAAPQGGATNFVLQGSPKGMDLTGYYLIDEVNGYHFLIQYGVDGSGYIAVPYDQTSTGTGYLNTAHTYSVVAGYYLGLETQGTTYNWMFGTTQQTMLISQARALGYSTQNIPVWGYQ